MFVVLMVGAAAAAPAVDSETTATGTESALTDGASVADFNASDTDQLQTLQASYATTKPEIKVIDPETGNTIETFTNASSPDYFTSTGGSGPYYFNTTFNESDFAAMPMNAGENKSVTLRLIDNSSLDNPGSGDMTNVTVYLENTNERAVVYAGDQNTGDDVTGDVTGTFSEAKAPFGIESLTSVPYISAHDTYDVEAEGVDVNNTDVYVVYGDDNGSDAFTTALNDRRSYESGDWNKYIRLNVDGSPAKVFQSSTPDDLEDNTTYGVTTEVGPSNTEAVKVTGAATEDKDTIDLTTNVNNFDFGYVLSLSLSGIGIMTLFVFGSLKRRESEDDEA
jgi:hypothetical protein